MATFQEHEISNVLQNLADSCLEQALGTLEKLTESTKDENFRSALRTSTFDVLEEALVFLGDEKDDPLALKCLLECFRSLRNSVANCPDNQSYVGQESRIVPLAVDVMEGLLDEELETGMDIDGRRLACLRTGIQFLSNLTVQHDRNQRLVWTEGKRVLSEALTSHDERLLSYSALTLANILKGNPAARRAMYEEESVSMFLKPLVKLIAEEDAAHFAVETLLFEPDYIETVYPMMEMEARLPLLELVRTCANQLPWPGVSFLCDQFKSRCRCILETCEGLPFSKGLEPKEMSYLLNFLGAVSSSSVHVAEIQEDQDLLLTCLDLLKRMHDLGQSGGNNFAPVKKLSELSLTEKEEEVKAHPSYGFKRGLIRMVGNMAFQHTVNQDKVREVEGIPLLLDCCNMDGRNPFIVQWVVMAVRNLCEGNAANQAVIASMRNGGTVDSAVLHELGISVVQKEGGKFVVKQQNG